MTDERPIVAQLFDAIGIKRVIYVDDRFGVTKERVAGVCRGLTIEQIGSSQAFPDLELTDDEAVRERRLSKAIHDADDSTLPAVFDKIVAVAGIGGNQQDRAAAQAFSDIVGSTTEMRLLSGADWQTQSPTLIAEAKAIPTLFVFDDDFRLEGDSADAGRRMIMALHSQLQDYKYAYALLTHNATTDAAETALETMIAQQFPAIEDFLVVIAKTRLTGADRDRFVHRLKSTLLFRLFRRLKEKLKDAAQVAHETALKKINSFGVDAFERIIHRSSSEEGAWAPETLVRVFGIMHEQEIRSRLRGDTSLHTSISEIDPLCGIETGGVSDDTARIAEELQCSEIYEKNDDLNKLHLPIACGDVFQSTDGQRCIVVAQACELVVRKDGRRRKDERDERQVVTLLKVSSKPKGKKSPRWGDNEFELAHFIGDGDNLWCAEVNQAIHVPAWILDLAVLNSDGQCRMASNQRPAPLLTLPWKARLPILNQRAADVVALAHTTSVPAGNPREHLLRALVRLPLSTNIAVEIGPPKRRKNSSWSLQVRLQRSLRLRERYATALLGHYANYLSRPAQPHDLTNLG